MQVALTVGDLEEGIAFYEKTLGLKLLFRAGTMAFFDCGGTRLLVSNENDTQTKTILYYEVDDIHGASAKLGERGVKLDKAPHEIAKLADRDVWLATFRGPLDTVHATMSEVKRAALTPSR